MSLFLYNRRALKFRLVNLPNDVHQEITNMILDNGGEAVDIDDPLVISFTVPDNYVLGEVMYGVQFIKDCVRWEEIVDLHKYKLGSRKACDGCTMSIFLHESCSNATKCLNCIGKKHPGLLQGETEVSPKLEKLQTDGNASSREASSIYETAEDSINSSSDKNLSLMQAIQDGTDELHTHNESRTNIILTKQMKEIDQSDLGSQRSVKRPVICAEHKLHLDKSEIIHISSDSQSDQSSNLEERFSVLRSAAKKRSRISSEEKKSHRSDNRTGHGRRDYGERKSEISRKGKRKPESSLIRRKHLKSNLSSGSNIDVLAISDTNNNGKKSMQVPKRKRKLPTHNASSVDGTSILNEDPQSIEDSTVSLTDSEDNEANRVLKRRKTLPSTSYAMSTDDSDDVQEATGLVNDKSRSKKDDNEDKHPTVSTSEFVKIRHDSESPHRIEVRAESKNASHRPVRTGLNINREKNGRPIQTNRDLQEWLRWAKHKAQNMAAPRMRNFAKWEKWHMLIFLIENDLIDRAKGLDTWQYMINQEDCGHRTKMSLNNHFLKYILPHIEEFHLPRDIETKFVVLRNMKGH